LTKQLILQSVLALMMVMSPLQAAASERRAALSTGFEAFENCFARAQDDAGRPWAFVPSAGAGGAFTNLGAKAAGSPYRLLLRARQAGNSVRLIAHAPSAELAAAIERCR
jgi:hypothetical protein